MDYSKFAQLAYDHITDKGREIHMFKLSSTVADPLKPWRGTAVRTKIGEVGTFGLFVVPDTSIPTQSRGLAFDWISDELIKRCRRVCLVPALTNPDLEQYHIIKDDVKEFEIIWGQALKPGDTPLFYVFGLAE